MEEETVVCAKCGREVPKTLYCIYCGSPLFKQEKEAKKPAPSPEGPVKPMPEPIKPKPEVKEMPAPRAATPPHLEPQVRPKPARAVPVDPEITKLMDDLRNNYIWKVKLCGVICDDGVSEGVFTTLFEEYINKINQLGQVRNDKIGYYREEFGAKKAALDGAERKLEELKVRAAVGQISSADLEAQAPELEERIANLDLETSRLGAQLARLNDLMRDTPPRDIFDLEKTASRCLDSLDLMVTNGKVSNKLGGDLRKDLEAALNVFDGIIGDKKQREKGLTERLSTLEARYKVGEITISEFEGLKRKINAELEQIWV